MKKFLLFLSFIAISIVSHSQTILEVFTSDEMVVLAPSAKLFYGAENNDSTGLVVHRDYQIIIEEIGKDTFDFKVQKFLSERSNRYVQSENKAIEYQYYMIYVVGTRIDANTYQVHVTKGLRHNVDFKLIKEEGAFIRFIDDSIVFERPNTIITFNNLKSSRS